MRTTSRLSVVGLGVLCTALCASPCLAENIATPEPALILDSFFAADTSCGTYSFVDDVFTMDSGAAARPFVLSTGDTVNGRIRLQVRVDPVSGASGGGGVPLVNVEQGQIHMVGSSDTLPINDDVVVIARVIGAEYPVPLVGSTRFLAAVDYLHPSVASVAGDVGHVSLVYFDSPWFGTGNWQAEIVNETGCFASSPELFLNGAPLDGPSPLTFELEATTVSQPAGRCPLADGPTPETIKISYTFDANSLDQDPDPNVGRYLSCDDTYGSRSGTRVTVEGRSWQSACVAITVENDIDTGGGVPPFDQYTVQILGDERLSGAFLFVRDAGGSSFSDDSLPLTPPDINGAFVSPFAPFVGLNPGVTTCEFPVTPVSLTQVGDVDSDGVADTADNCIDVYNALQRDSNGDGFGNACDPDLNNDLITNVQDLGLLRAAFFNTGNEDADFNSDGIVNIVDLGVMRTRFFEPPGPSALVH